MFTNKANISYLILGSASCVMSTAVGSAWVDVLQSTVAELTTELFTLLAAGQVP